MVCCIEFIQSLGFQIVLRVSHLQMFTFRTICQPRACITQYNIPWKWFIDNIYIHLYIHFFLSNKLELVNFISNKSVTAHGPAHLLINYIHERLWWLKCLCQIYHTYVFKTRQDNRLSLHQCLYTVSGSSERFVKSLHIR